MLDGSDNSETRYLVNRVAARLEVPVVGGALTQWEGQIEVWDPGRGAPCYECVFRWQRTRGWPPIAAEAGVLGPLPGVMGSMMAVEAVKVLTDAGERCAGALCFTMHCMARRGSSRPRAGRTVRLAGWARRGREAKVGAGQRSPYMTNPLMETWDTPFGLPPFERIEDAHFGPAIDAALAEARAEVARIADSEETPGFDNTIRGLTEAGEALERALGVFFGIAGAESTEAREALMRELSPKLSDHASDIYGNRALFARIETLWTAGGAGPRAGGGAGALSDTPGFRSGGGGWRGLRRSG